jgi:hypothetical protein
VREIRMLRTTWRELETELGDGLRHRRVAKAAGKRLLPGPKTTAPALDPTQREVWRNEPQGIALCTDPLMLSLISCLIVSSIRDGHFDRDAPHPLVPREPQRGVDQP